MAITQSEISLSPDRNLEASPEYNRLSDHVVSEALPGSTIDKSPLLAVNLMEGARHGSGSAGVQDMLSNFVIGDYAPAGQAGGMAQGDGPGVGSGVGSGNERQGSHGSEGTMTANSGYRQTDGSSDSNNGHDAGPPPSGSQGRSGASAGENSGERSAVELPPKTELQTAPIDSLTAKLRENYASLAKTVEANFANLPHLGFHGTSDDSAAAIAESKTSKGTNDQIYVATTANVEGDAHTYVKDLMRSVDYSRTAGDSGAAATKVMVVDTNLTPDKFGSYGIDEISVPPLFGQIPGSDNLGKEQIKLNPENYDDHVLGVIDTSPYARHDDSGFLAADPEKYTRMALSQAFVEQNLAADALQIAVQNKPDQ